MDDAPPLPSCRLLAALRFHKRPDNESRAARRCLKVGLGVDIDDDEGGGEADEEDAEGDGLAMLAGQEAVVAGGGYYDDNNDDCSQATFDAIRGERDVAMMVLWDIVLGCGKR